MERKSTRGFKVLVVAPGATTSTYDVFSYTLRSMRDVVGEDRVRGFYMHNSIMYHAKATSDVFPDLPEERVVSLSQVRAAMDVFTEIVLGKPDVIHIIDGTILPLSFFMNLFGFRAETKRRFIVSVHLTEEPYASEYTTSLIKLVDVVFVNDAAAAARFDADGLMHLYYSPHAYYPEIHYPDFGSDKPIDVFMCGTLYKSRLEFLNEVDWSGVSAKIAGVVPEGLEHLVSPGLSSVLTPGFMDNAVVAEYYRKCKIAINLHRTMKLGFGSGDIDSSDAYSVGPRIIEAAACGAFQLSDYRQEIVDVFGGTIPIFSSPSEFQGMMRHYLENDAERLDLAIGASEAVRQYTCKNRSMFMLERFQEALESVLEQRFGGRNED